MPSRLSSVPQILARSSTYGRWRGSGARVTAAPAEHVQPWLNSLAYCLDGAEGSIVFTGDTARGSSI